MGKKTAISWAHATFNCWWGCTEVGGSPACGGPDFGGECYAKTWDRRTGGDHWGNDKPRRFFGDKHWAEPLKWNRDAEKEGVRRRVFCMSMGDWAEGRPDQRFSLECLYNLIYQTPWLDWLMLTKRPQLIEALWPSGWLQLPRPNVWMGTTVEDQHWMDIRWRYLREVGAVVHWLSMEPLFEKVKLPADFLALGKRAWVIVGGQSGSGAAPMNPDIPRYVRDQCVEAGVPFHFKQNGEWIEFRQSGLVEFPPKCRTAEVQQTTQPDQCGVVTLCRVGKKAAGRLLDGREWNEVPEVRPCL